MPHRYLKAWDIEDVSKEFLLWGTFQQVDCLTSLDAYTAAGILTRTPEAVRKDLLGMLEPFVAANIVQVCAGAGAFKAAPACSLIWR